MRKDYAKIILTVYGAAGKATLARRSPSAMRAFQVEENPPRLGKAIANFSKDWEGFIRLNRCLALNGAGQPTAITRFKIG